MINITEMIPKINKLCVDMNVRMHADFTSVPMSVTFNSNTEDGEVEFTIGDDAATFVNCDWTITDSDLNKLKKIAQDFMTAYLLEYFVYVKVKKAQPDQTYTFA